MDKCFKRLSCYYRVFVFGDLHARLGQRRAGEGSILGEHCFWNEAKHSVVTPNHDFLMELCSAHGLIVANTLLVGPDYQRATYYEPRAVPLDAIPYSCFNVLEITCIAK